MSAGRAAATLLACALTLVVSCGGDDGAPRAHRPGRRLPWPEVTEPVRDWSFATAIPEIALETRSGADWHSVTLWCVVVDGHLYVATDSSSRPKRWVQLLNRDPEARVGIGGRVYRVRASAVTDSFTWDAVTAAYARKYGDAVRRYDFPRAGNVSAGHVFRLASR